MYEAWLGIDKGGSWQVQLAYIFIHIQHVSIRGLVEVNLILLKALYELHAVFAHRAWGFEIV